MPPVYQAEELTPEMVASLVDKAWQAALKHMAWITHHGTPKDLEKEFAAWWASEGRKFMTQGSGGGEDLVAAEDEGEVEDDMGSLEQEPGDDEMPQDENLRILQAAEDHAAIKSELAQLSAVAETALQDKEELAPLSAVADTALQDKGASTDLAPAETKACADADWLAMQRCYEDLETFDMENSENLTTAGVMNRQMELMLMCVKERVCCHEPACWVRNRRALGTACSPS